jgi:hypothetical protein
MKLYVANASLQTHQFQYRIPDSPQLRQREIPSMGQAILPDDMNQAQIDYVVNQMAPYGFPSADDVRSRNTPKKFTRLVYSVDRPVSENIIAALFSGNQVAQKEVSDEMRKTIAYETDRQISEDVARAQQQEALADLHSVQFQVEEQEPSRGFERPDEEVVNVIYDVAKQDGQAKLGRGRPRKSF